MSNEVDKLLQDSIDNKIVNMVLSESRERTVLAEIAVKLISLPIAQSDKGEFNQTNQGIKVDK